MKSITIVNIAINMTSKEIFLAKLKKANYKNEKADKQSDFNSKLVILEIDRESVFEAMYGDTLIKDRGVKKIKESVYRLLEAESDVKNGFIKMTMHYLIMQIFNKHLKL